MMSHLRGWLKQVRTLVRRGDVERELREELAFHLEMEAEKHARAGVPKEEAMRRARLSFGGEERYKEEVREARWTGLVASIARDLRLAMRGLVRSPGFTVVAVVVLGIGIGAPTAVFTVVNGALFTPPPGMASVDRLVRIYTSDYSGPLYGTSSLPDARDFEAGAASVLSGVAASTFEGMTVAGDGVGRRVTAELVSGDWFELLGVRMARGRAIEPDDDRRGATAVAVISDAFWRGELGGAADVIGRELRLSGVGYTVVGVADRSFRGSSPTAGVALWIPASVAMGEWIEERGNRTFDLFGRLRAGQSIEQLKAALPVTAARLHAEHPAEWTNLQQAPRTVTVVSAAHAMVPPGDRARVVGLLGMLMVLVLLVLMVAAANVAGLLLARAGARRREVAVRVAIGAGRRRLVRQFVTESAVLGLLGGGAGIVLAYALTRAAAVWAAPAGLPFALDAALDTRVLGFAGLVALGTGIVFGLVPAIHAVRPDPMAVLRDTNARLRSWRGGVRGALVVGQVAAALVLLLTATLFMRSLRAAQQMDPGFDPTNVVLAGFDLGAEGWSAEQGRTFMAELAERLRGSAGVRSVTIAARPPLGAAMSRRTVSVEGYSPGPGEEMEHPYNTVGPAYFEATRLPLVRGRDFTPADASGAPPVVIVNEEFARRYFPDGRAIGRQIGWGSGGPLGPMIVGVARTTPYNALDEEPRPFVWVPWLQSYEGSVGLQIRTVSDPAALVPALRDQVRQLAGDLPIVRVTTLREQMNALMAPQRVAGTALGGFGVAALLLAAVGVYGLIAFQVGRRRREIGIRIALGARPADATRMIVRHGLGLAGLGILLGVRAAAATTRLIGGFLFGVSPLDPAAFLIAAATLAAAALAASWFPARRAARIDPAATLRDY